MRPILIPLALAAGLLAPCEPGTPTPSVTPTPAPPTATGTDAEPTVDGEDLVMRAEDFQCILQGSPVHRFYVWNHLDHLDEALAVAASPEGGTFPVGTVLQLIPTEAMVKRGKGFSPETHDWEYFFLKVDQNGTTIVSRGGDPAVGPTGVVNGLGGNCQGCHSQAVPPWDFVCETGHGCDPLPFTEGQIRTVQGNDPRCP